MVQKLSLAGGDGTIQDAETGKLPSSFDNLRRHYLFAGLTPGDFASLMRHVTEIRIGKGEVLFHQGDGAEYFYFVDSGQIELNLLAPTGQKKLLEIIGPDRTFAEAVAFMRGRKYPVTCEVLSDAVLCRIPNENYVDLICGNPDACMRLLGDLSQHLHARVREIERLTVQNANDRLVSYLMEHIVESRDDEATIRIDLPRHVVASRLSITPETLSRLLRNLVDKGILTIEDRLIFVHSLTRLRPYS